VGLQELKFPLNVGDKWQGLFYYEYVGTGTVSVPAGTFGNCYKIEIKNANGDHVSTSWFKPGVGFVKYFGAYELRSFTLN
jgi:hypothetical protein